MTCFKVLPLVAALALTGCMSMAPSYERPKAPVEASWPAGAAYADAKLNQQALPDWQEFFTDGQQSRLPSGDVERAKDALRI